MRDVERNNPMEPPSFYDGALEPVTLSVPPHPPPPPLLLPPRASRALRMSRELGKQGAGSREQGETPQDRASTSAERPLSGLARLGFVPFIQFSLPAREQSIRLSAQRRAWGQLQSQAGSRSSPKRRGALALVVAAARDTTGQWERICSPGVSNICQKSGGV
jgi:hypothetical protein